MPATVTIGMIALVVHAALLGLYALLCFYVAAFLNEHPTHPSRNEIPLWKGAAVLCPLAAVLLVGLTIMVGLQRRAGYQAALVTELIIGAAGTMAAVAGAMDGFQSITGPMGLLSAVLSVAVCACLIPQLASRSAHE